MMTDVLIAILLVVAIVAVVYYLVKKLSVLLANAVVGLSQWMFKALGWRSWSARSSGCASACSRPRPSSRSKKTLPRGAPRSCRRRNSFRIDSAGCESRGR